MAQAGKTEPALVCLDSDVVIAGLFSRQGASHAVLMLGEIGLLRLVIPVAVEEEVRRNLGSKLPDAIPLFEQFLRSVAVAVHHPSSSETNTAMGVAHSKDVPIMAAALGAGAKLLVTHNVRHFRSTSSLRVIRPRVLIEEVRAWVAGFGG